jgi:hypothetical protein
MARQNQGGKKGGSGSGSGSRSDSNKSGKTTKSDNR